MLDDHDRAVAAAPPGRRGGWSTAVVPGGSRLAVGSSSTSRPGSGARMSARARRCCSPPDRAPVGRASKPARPTSARAAGTAASIRSRAQPRFSRPKATSSATCGITSCVSGSWKTSPTSCPRTPGGVLATSRSPTRRAPSPGTGQGVRHDPCEGPRERALAAARGADDQEEPAGVEGETEVVEGRPGPARVGPPEPDGPDGRRRSRCVVAVGHAPPGKVSRTPVRRSAVSSHQPRSPARTTPEMTSTTAIVPCTSRPNLSDG